MGEREKGCQQNKYGDVLHGSAGLTLGSMKGTLAAGSEGNVNWGGLKEQRTRCGFCIS